MDQRLHLRLQRYVKNQYAPNFSAKKCKNLQISMCHTRQNRIKLVLLYMHCYGIVLHTLRYGDSQLIVDIFTQSAGLVSFLVRLPRNGRAGVRASTCQPLALVEVVWEQRPQASLQKPKELTLWRPWRSITLNPYKAAMGLFLSEFLYHALRREQENEMLFDFVNHALSWFDESEKHYANFHIIFLMHLTRFLGFLPNIDDWQEGCFFDLQSATFTRARPLHILYLNPEEAALVPKFLRMDLRSMQAVSLNRAIRQRALQIVTDFYRLHIPEFPQLHSLEILAEVFD